MTISAKVIADSISEAGVRITTFELEYPRFIHAEFMTHRMFSRNAASSRAIPVEKMIKQIEDNPAMPIHWGKNQPGMQAKEECDALIDCTNGTYLTRTQAWEFAAMHARVVAEAFNAAGYHKQIVNRLLEPFAHIKVVCTATEYDNFFELRRHPDAQPEIHELANQMWDARDASTPRLLGYHDWHLPYYANGWLEFTNHDHSEQELTEALMISASCCAQVSYRVNDPSLEKAKRIYKQLIESKPMHASPFEHQATPMKRRGLGRADSGTTHESYINGNPEWWSANFRGWVQYRQLI